MKVLLLGCGLVGRAIAVDLNNDKDIKLTAADINKDNLNKLNSKSIATIWFDASDTNALTELLDDFDLVINAVPGFLGFKTLQKIINTGTDVVDIAFYEEDPFSLQELAIKNNVTALVDCGISPGLSNLLIGNSLKEFDTIKNIEIYVGGLPKEKDGLFDYKAVFSISDLIEEYLRPARSIINNKIITTSALSEIKEISFKNYEPFEAFNSDGLRTLLKTIKAENMGEYTVRYKGHTEKMKLLRDASFFSKEVINIKGKEISSFDFSTALLSKVLQFTETDKDITLLKIILEGEHNNRYKKVIYEMIDEYDNLTNTHSMARTTGFMAAMCVRLLVNNKFDKKGIFPPELFGQNETIYNYVMSGLEDRNIIVGKRIV